LKKILLAIFLLAAAPAFADTVDVFNFNQNLGDIGKSDLFKLGILQVLLTGYSSPGVTADMWEKNLGPTEFGIGLAAEEDREISGTNFVQVDLSKINNLSRVINISISINSIQAGEAYDVWGSNSAGTLGTLIAADQTSENFTLPRNFDFISITAPEDNVTIDDIDITVTPPTPTPESSTLFLFGIGAGFAFLASRKWQKT
jgi:hypothetical protein